MYAITRLQAGSGTWCWSVNLSRAGKLYSRRFYDPKYGGSRAARLAAIAWRDEQLASIKALGILEYCELKRGNNTSGATGATFTTSARQPDGVWQARLKLAGDNTQTKSFSVRLYGERRAFAMAVKARRQMLAAAEDRAFVRDKLARRVAAR
jgi:hypothetical protein